MKHFLVTPLLLISALLARALGAPEYPSLVVKENCAKAGHMFLQAAEWLNETHIDQQLEL